MSTLQSRAIFDEILGAQMLLNWGAGARNLSQGRNHRRSEPFIMPEVDLIVYPNNKIKAFGAFAQLHVQETNGVIYSMGRKEIWKRVKAVFH